MDFEDTDKNKDVTAADRFDPEGTSEPVSDVGQVSISEKLRILGNRMQAEDALEGAAEDAEGKDETDLSGSLDHAKLALLSSGAMSSDMYSSLQALVHRAQERNAREEKQQVQISIAEDREEKKRKQDEDAEEEFEGSVDRVKAEEKREREREEWSKSTHSFAGVELTGEEWGQLADKLKSVTALRRWLTAKMKKDGMTDAEAHTMISKVSLAMEMQSVPPDQWTPEMKALDQEMKNDPALKEKVEGYVRDTATNKMSGLNVSQDHTARSATGSVSVDARTAAFELPVGQSDNAKLSALNEYVAEAHALSQRAVPGAPAKAANGSKGTDEAFASAPDLSEHYQKAATATEPLDAEKAKPQQVAANDLKATPPASSPGSGFAV